MKEKGEEQQKKECTFQEGEREHIPRQVQHWILVYTTEKKRPYSLDLEGHTVVFGYIEINTL